MLHHNGCPMPWQPTPHCVSLLMYHLTMFDQALRAAQSPLDNKNLWKTAKIDWGDELIFSMLINIHQLFPVSFHCFSSAPLTQNWVCLWWYALLSTKSLPLTRGFVYNFTHPASLWFLHAYFLNIPYGVCGLLHQAHFLLWVCLLTAV